MSKYGKRQRTKVPSQHIPPKAVSHLQKKILSNKIFENVEKKKNRPSRGFKPIRRPVLNWSVTGVSGSDLEDLCVGSLSCGSEALCGPDLGASRPRESEDWCVGSLSCGSEALCGLDLRASRSSPVHGSVDITLLSAAPMAHVLRFFPVGGPVKPLPSSDAIHWTNCTRSSQTRTRG